MNQPNQISVEAGKQYWNAFKLVGPVSPPTLPPPDPSTISVCGHDIHFSVSTGVNGDAFAWSVDTIPEKEIDGFRVEFGGGTYSWEPPVAQHVSGILNLWRLSSSPSAVVVVAVWITPSIQSILSLRCEV